MLQASLTSQGAPGASNLPPPSNAYGYTYRHERYRVLS
ncbi:hypothetical protein HALA3H3_p20029 [Halomonas sp. A3H3]|nr:hypothetical protein HALA3H3_p20029 [Halomonas sp. A3H3]